MGRQMKNPRMKVMASPSPELSQTLLFASLCCSPASKTNLTEED
jgi:hypothetical protein